MNLLFLRGKLPLDFRPDRLEYDTIDECEDMWTVLCERLSRKFNNTELWYYGSGKKRKTKVVTNKFVERWTDISDSHDFNPDIIIARGGFPEYITICNRFPTAMKIYYGAGVRSKPTDGHWDLVLVDSEAQRKRTNGELFIKPAADIFKPYEAEKKYDICFVANSGQREIKRHRLAFSSIAGTDLTMLHIGLNKDVRGWASNSKIKFAGWKRRHLLPKMMAKCQIGLICSTSYDSCPRVLPEYLACNLPVVATRNMHFWHSKYINEDTGTLCDESEILEAIRSLLDKKLNPRLYYDKFLSLDRAAEHLNSLIEQIRRK